ncbi:unnamed protein product [Dovyalis caffra]|uniref:Uncharacterized protein n=1 Tax=Dovyalis caffra TaxID=77055 RepID=A0AAV1R6H3_9ROSI|nr:unnamed protein product [Dovyalis caffra]
MLDDTTLCSLKFVASTNAPRERVKEERAKKGRKKRNKEGDSVKHHPDCNTTIHCRRAISITLTATPPPPLPPCCHNLHRGLNSTAAISTIHHCSRLLLSSLPKPSR